MPNNTSKLTLPRGTKVPDHIAIIPDGNRRWARARGKHTLEGHRRGFERAVELAKSARELGVHTVTLWGFSTENWDRTKEEISYLMKLYVKLLNDYIKEAHKDEVKIVHLGRKDRIPGFLLDRIKEAENETRHYKKYIANIAIDHGGHDDIIRAVKRMVEDGVSVSSIDKGLFEKYLDTHGQPYPYVDLMIRTSGEQRTSGFLLWQSEYAEVYWEDVHFPDFTPSRLREAVLDYSRRRRRYGGNDEVKHIKFRPEVAAGLEVKWWRLGKIPQGESFGEYAMNHLREQYGLSKKLAKEAAGYMILGLSGGTSRDWRRSLVAMKKFYKLIKEELKLAFEPEIAASLQLKLWQDLDKPQENWNGDVEESACKLYAEVYRMSLFQAAKLAHLRVMATAERRMAEAGGGDEHWKNAEDYLQKFYRALADRVS